MNLQTILYSAYESTLPQEGTYILGQTQGTSIIVYQAFNDQIADHALANQKFGGQNYSFSRMTWIKPNFLWMMYRSGWAEKKDQNRILAIEMTLAGFFHLLEQGISTSYQNSYESEQSWRKLLSNSNVRIQWDPDHDPIGRKLKRRAVQIGIKSDALEEFNNKFIVSIADITRFVSEQKKILDQDAEQFLVIKENVVELSNTLKNKFSISDWEKLRFLILQNVIPCVSLVLGLVFLEAYSTNGRTVRETTVWSETRWAFSI